MSGHQGGGWPWCAAPPPMYLYLYFCVCICIIFVLYNNIYEMKIYDWAKKEAWPSHPAAPTLTTPFLLHNWVPTASNGIICICICIYICTYLARSTTEICLLPTNIRLGLPTNIWVGQLEITYNNITTGILSHLKTDGMMLWNWTQFCKLKPIFLSRSLLNFGPEQSPLGLNISVEKSYKLSK